MSENGARSQEDDERSRWEQFRQLAVEELEKGDCSELFKAMELEEGESETDIDVMEEDLEKTGLITDFSSTKRNLLSELEECDDTSTQALGLGATQQETKMGTCIATGEAKKVQRRWQNYTTKGY